MQSPIVPITEQCSVNTMGIPKRVFGTGATASPEATTAMLPPVPIARLNDINAFLQDGEKYQTAFPSSEGIRHSYMDRQFSYLRVPAD
ncbi:hypothetical protein ES703_61042 [subsurface metagenome]